MFGPVMMKKLYSGVAICKEVAINLCCSLQIWRNLNYNVVWCGNGSMDILLKKRMNSINNTHLIAEYWTHVTFIFANLNNKSEINSFTTAESSQTKSFR